MIEAAMAAHKFMLSEFAWDERHRVPGIEDVLTPALVVYPEIVASNIAQDLASARRRSGSLAAAHQDRQAGLYASHAGRAECPEFQVRNHARTAGGLQ